MQGVGRWTRARSCRPSGWLLACFVAGIASQLGQPKFCLRSLAYRDFSRFSIKLKIPPFVVPLSYKHVRSQIEFSMRRELFVSFLLVAAVAAVYWPVHSYPFVLLDDHGYVVENPYVRNGLTCEGMVHAFTGITVGNWHPLTMLSHMLDCQLFGVEEGAGWHHVVNLALHAANTVLLFLALRWMTGALWRSALVAALFGLHPLHVESVAWVSERKDVLSTLFFMLTLLAYYHYVRRPTILRYAAVFVLLALGLMSKPMLVTAPFVLLLLDYWPLGRMRMRHAQRRTRHAERGVELRHLPRTAADRRMSQQPRRTAANGDRMPENRASRRSRRQRHRRPERCRRRGGRATAGRRVGQAAAFAL